MDTKIKILILSLFTALNLFGQSPLSLAVRYNITSATGGDPYTVVGVVSDDLSRFTGSDIAIGDSLYVIDGSDLYVLKITAINSVVGPTVNLTADDPSNAGISLPTGQSAIVRPTPNYKLPIYISGLRDDLRSMMMNRQAKIIDQITGGGVASITDFISAGQGVPPSALASSNGGETWRNMTTGELWRSDGGRWHPFVYDGKECQDTVLVSAITVQSGGSVTTGSPLIRNSSGVWEHMYNHPSGLNLIPDGVVTDIITGPRAIIQYCGVRKGSGATPNTSYYVDQSANTGFTTTKPTTNIRPLGKVSSNGDFLVNAGLLFSRDNLQNAVDSTFAKTPGTYANKRITDNIYKNGTLGLRTTDTTAIFNIKTDANALSADQKNVIHISHAPSSLTDNPERSHVWSIYDPNGLAGNIPTDKKFGRWYDYTTYSPNLNTPADPADTTGDMVHIMGYNLGRADNNLRGSTWMQFEQDFNQPGSPHALKDLMEFHLNHLFLDGTGFRSINANATTDGSYIETSLGGDDFRIAPARGLINPVMIWDNRTRYFTFFDTTQLYFANNLPGAIIEKYRTSTTNPMNIITQNADNSVLIGDSWGVRIKDTLDIKYAGTQVGGKFTAIGVNQLKLAAGLTLQTSATKFLSFSKIGIASPNDWNMAIDGSDTWYFGKGANPFFQVFKNVATDLFTLRDQSVSIGQSYSIPARFSIFQNANDVGGGLALVNVGASRTGKIFTSTTGLHLVGGGSTNDIIVADGKTILGNSGGVSVSVFQGIQATPQGATVASPGDIALSRISSIGELWGKYSGTATNTGWGKYLNLIDPNSATSGQVLGWNGSTWLPVTNLGTTSWQLTGNSVTAGTQFLGSTNNVSLRFRTNNLQRAMIDSTGNFGIANIAPTEKLDVTGNVRFSGALMPNNTAGTSGQVLTSAGAGVVPTWTTNTSESTSVGTFNNTGNSNGLSLSGSALSLHAATISTPGAVNVGQQTFGVSSGTKLFNGTGSYQIDVDGDTDNTPAGITFTQLGGADQLGFMYMNSADANNASFRLSLEEGGALTDQFNIGTLNDTKGIQERGGLYEDVTSVTTSPYTVLYGDRNIYLDGTSITVNLQAIGTAAGETKVGRVIYFFNDNATNVTITPNGSETINDSASLTLLPNTGVTLLAVTGTKWITRD